LRGYYGNEYGDGCGDEGCGDDGCHYNNKGYATINLLFLALLASRESTRTRMRRARQQTGGKRKGTDGRGIATPSIAMAAPSFVDDGTNEIPHRCPTR
jgi:hypothetical protein